MKSDSRNDKLVISVSFYSQPDAKETTLKCLKRFKFHRLIEIPYKDATKSMKKVVLVPAGTTLVASISHIHKLG